MNVAATVQDDQQSWPGDQQSFVDEQRLKIHKCPFNFQEKTATRSVWMWSASDDETSPKNAPL